MATPDPVHLIAQHLGIPVDEVRQMSIEKLKEVRTSILAQRDQTQARLREHPVTEIVIPLEGVETQMREAGLCPTCRAGQSLVVDLADCQPFWFVTHHHDDGCPVINPTTD